MPPQDSDWDLMSPDEKIDRVRRQRRRYNKSLSARKVSFIAYRLAWGWAILMTLLVLGFEQPNPWKEITLIANFVPLIYVAWLFPLGES